MQNLTLLLHIVLCIIAVFIYRNNKFWKYFAIMLFYSNFVGAIFYVLITVGVSGHPTSLLRSLLQVLGWLFFSIPLLNRKYSNGKS